MAYKTYNNFYLFQFYRFMSHITFGKTRKHFQSKKSLYKTVSQQFIETLEEKFDEFRKILTYKRVPGWDKQSASVYDYVSAIVLCSVLHQKAFGDKQYKYIGRDVVVTATGPSFQCYKPIKNAIHIGVNTAYRKSDISYDAMFCQDNRCFGTKIPKDWLTYRNSECDKFIGNTLGAGYFDINENEYSIYHYMSESKFNYFIDIAPLPDFGSVIFSAFSYALWTHPKRIFLVGADCSFGHAAISNTQHVENLEYLVKPWKMMQNFIMKYYDDVEIISVNPIGLRGMFKDVYTREFLKDHPEIDPKTVTLLETELKSKNISKD